MFGLFKSRKVKRLEEKIKKLRLVNSELLSLIDGKDCVVSKTIDNTKDLFDYLEKKKEREEAEIINAEFKARNNPNRVCKDCECNFNNSHRGMMDYRYFDLIRDICDICRLNYESNYDLTPSGYVTKLVRK